MHEQLVDHKHQFECETVRAKLYCMYANQNTKLAGLFATSFMIMSLIGMVSL